MDQVILSTHHHQNPEYMATNAWEPRVHQPIYTYYLKKNSDSYKTYATKSPKITIFALKEKSTKGFSIYCIGKDFKTTESHTKHQLKTHKKLQLGI